MFDVSAAFSECVIELEPMVRKFDEIDFLEAVLEIKRSKVIQESSLSSLYKFFRHYCAYYKKDNSNLRDIELKDEAAAKVSTSTW